VPLHDKRVSAHSKSANPPIVQSAKPRPRLIRLLKRFPQRLVWALFVLAMGFVSIAILAVIAMFTHTLFVFPSLGPTAILFFFHPMSASASPRHALYGHAIGILCGYGSLVLLRWRNSGWDPALRPPSGNTKRV
jgi:hypothetical protein